MKTYLCRASNLKSTTFLALVSWRKSFSGTGKKPLFLELCVPTLHRACYHTGGSQKLTSTFRLRSEKWW